jgi:hypothetical protein
MQRNGQKRDKKIEGENDRGEKKKEKKLQKAKSF